MNQAHFKQRINSLLRLPPIRWLFDRLGITYIIALHLAILFFVIPAGEHRDYLTQQEAEKIAHGVALKECLKENAPAVNCLDLKFKFAELRNPGESQFGVWERLFKYTVNNDDPNSYRQYVVISISGENLTPVRNYEQRR